MGDSRNHPANKGLVMLTLWVEPGLRHYVRTRAQEAGWPVSRWAGMVLHRAVSASPLGAFCLGVDPAAIRAEKIRAVLACQWGVAVALVQRWQFFCGDYRCGGLSGAEAAARDVADLPTAEEIVDEAQP